MIRKPRRLDFGQDGAAQRVADPGNGGGTAAPSQQRPPIDPSQRSDSVSMVELDNLSAVPEELRRQSESGSLPVSLKALQASDTGRWLCMRVPCQLASSATHGLTPAERHKSVTGRPMKVSAARGRITYALLSVSG